MVCPCLKSGVMFSTSWSDSPVSSMGSEANAAMILVCFSLLVIKAKTISQDQRWYFRICLLRCHLDLPDWVLSGEEVCWREDSILVPSLDVPSPHHSLHPGHDLQLQLQKWLSYLSSPTHCGPPGLHLVSNLTGHPALQEVQLYEEDQQLQGCREHFDQGWLCGEYLREWSTHAEAFWPHLVSSFCIHVVQSSLWK